MWTDSSDKQYSWLMEAPKAEKKLELWGLGCTVCRWAGQKSEWARCTRRTTNRLVRHSDSVMHKEALTKLLEHESPLHRSEVAQTSGSNASPLRSGRPAGVGVGFAHVLKMLEIAHGGQ